MRSADRIASWGRESSERRRGTIRDPKQFPKDVRLKLAQIIGQINKLLKTNRNIDPNISCGLYFICQN